jgi:uncharacterized protein (DUF885 family)
MIDRRTLIRRSLGAAVALFAGRHGVVRISEAAAPSADEQLARLLQRLAEQHLRASPEEATRLGYDTSVDAALRSQLDDRSLEAIGLQRQRVASALADLRRIDRDALSASSRLDYDVASFVYTTLDDQLARYGFTDINLRPSPYVVSQMNGAYYWVPGFLGSQHPLQSRDDLDSYFARLHALARVIDQETERIRHDAAKGVVLPNFVLHTTLAQIETLRTTPPEQTAMIGPAITRAEAAGLGDIRSRAQQVFTQMIVPALSRQIAALQALKSQAGDKAGVWALPEGEEYYGSALRSNTTTSMSAARLHQLGLDLVADLTAQLDRELRALGYSSGSVAERIGMLDREPRFHVSDDDAGRTRLLSAAREAVDSMRALLPKGFRTIPDEPLEVRRVPPAIESGAPGGFYDSGGPGEPASFSLNLKSPSQMPLWRLRTLAHHEGLPGHHLQHAVLKAAGELSLFRRLVRFSAYTEGWALYAERVADELGAYREDPFGQIGLLQSELFRAARIVVDTGLHHKRWTRDQAVQWMVDHAGEHPVPARREVDRYCVYPGQACSFMVGATAIRAAREDARRILGARFDIRDFHDLVLRSGPVPLEVLEGLVRRWSATASA